VDEKGVGPLEDEEFRVWQVNDVVNAIGAPPAHHRLKLVRCTTSKRLLEVRDWCRDEDHPKEGLSRYFN
jgi:hypothetical protein